MSVNLSALTGKFNGVFYYSWAPVETSPQINPQWCSYSCIFLSQGWSVWPTAYERSGNMTFLKLDYKRGGEKSVVSLLGALLLFWVTSWITCLGKASCHFVSSLMTMWQGTKDSSQQPVRTEVTTSTRAWKWILQLHLGIEMTTDPACSLTAISWETLRQNTSLSGSWTPDSQKL